MQFTFLLWIRFVFFSSWFWKRCQIFKPFKVAEKKPPTTVLCVLFCWKKISIHLTSLQTMDPVVRVNVLGWYEEPKRFTTSPTTRSLNLVEMRLLGPTATANNKTKEFPPKKMVVKIVMEFPPKIAPKTCRFSGIIYSTFPEKWGSYEILSRSIVFSVMDVMDVNFWFEVHSSFFLCDLELMWILVYWETWEKNQRSGQSKSDPSDVAWNGLQKSQKFANFFEILALFSLSTCAAENLLMLRGSLLGILPICINLAGINECFLVKMDAENCKKEPDSPWITLIIWMQYGPNLVNTVSIYIYTHKYYIYKSSNIYPVRWEYFHIPYYTVP